MWRRNERSTIMDMLLRLILMDHSRLETSMYTMKQSLLKFDWGCFRSETPVEEIGQTYDKELVSRVETTQDNALKKLYAEYERGIVRKKKLLAFCHFVGHKIMPAIAIWFVISYWLAGMFQYYDYDFSTNVTVELGFSVVYFCTLSIIQFLVMAKAFD